MRSIAISTSGTMPRKSCTTSRVRIGTFGTAASAICSSPARSAGGCAAGSWDPQRPSPDPWGAQGGRLMTTCLAALTLEVYYRYIPLYKFGQEGRAGE